MPRGVPKERRCLACTHNKRPAIDRDLVLGLDGLRVIGERYGLNKDVMHRHSKHIDEATKRRIIAQDKREAVLSEHREIAATLNEDRVDISNGLRRIIKEVEGVLERAKEKEDDPLVLSGLREMRTTLESLAKLHGQLRTDLNVIVDLGASSQWQDLKAILQRVFAEHADAERAFICEVRHLGVIPPGTRRLEDA